MQKDGVWEVPRFYPRNEVLHVIAGVFSGDVLAVKYLHDQGSSFFTIDFSDVGEWAALRANIFVRLTSVK